MPELRGALDPHSEREPRVLLRVPADELVEVGIDHARAAHLDPSGVLADRAAGAAALEARHVGLHRRLREGEVVRAEADLTVGPVQLAHDVEERPLQVCHGDPLVDHEALELVEDREVSGVDGVAPVDATDREHVDRRPLVLHLVDLRRRGLGTQQRRVVEVERRARRACRMPRREAQRVEVVAGRFDFASVDDLVAEPEEDVLDVAAHLRRRME